MFGIRSPPRTEAPSKRSGSAKAGRSSITATSKSRSRAWRAMARETWPPPAMTSWGRLVTGSTSSSCASSSGTSRAVPWRICSMATSRARSSRPAEPSVPSIRPPARTSTRASSRSARPARWKADTNATGGPPRAASAAAAIASMPSTAGGHAGPLPASARIHIVPPHTSPVSQASSSVSWCSCTEAGSPARTLRAASMASASTQPPPRVPNGRSDSLPVRISLAPTTWGVLPWVRITVATANGTPAEASSCMRSNGEAMFRWRAAYEALHAARIYSNT